MAHEAQRNDERTYSSWKLAVLHWNASSAKLSTAIVPNKFKRHLKTKKKCTGGAASVTGKGKNPDNKDENPEVHLIYCLFQVEYLSGNWLGNMLHFK